MSTLNFSKLQSGPMMPQVSSDGRMATSVAMPSIGDPAGRPRRVLFISYAFPPVGGAGVQRVTKFVKYLPSQGWETTVLTVANPSVPAWDETLLKDVPEQTVIRRAKTFEPSYKMK